jgi:hypothetical protein
MSECSTAICSAEHLHGTNENSHPEAEPSGSEQ